MIYLVENTRKKEANPMGITDIPAEPETPEIVSSPEFLPEPVRSRKLRPEWILGIIAAAAALLLGIVLLMNRSYMTEKTAPSHEEDPELLQHQQMPESRLPHRALRPRSVL